MARPTPLLALALTCMTASTRTRADEPVAGTSADVPASPVEPPAATPVDPPVEGPVAAPIEIVEPPPRKNAFLVYPIALWLGRISLAYQRSLVGRHVLAIGAFAQASGFLIPTDAQAMAGAGGEIGYLFYSRAGMSGFFFGPSVGLGRYYYASSLKLKDVLAGDFSITKNSGFFSSFAFSFDAGYQHIFKNGGLLGFGLGAQYNFATKTEQEMSPIAFLFAGTGVRPRFLFVVGAAL